ncbi:Nucleoside phosphorylase [Penicillium italicum]|uniref:Nucleoside phosphorylase n=1 Tax=Penicillium italicum TaxID=40296 RepID=A0A0A2KPG0_PENIT|nr:Nucleoside phosphorylase [Penicillium italicum]
MQVARRAGLPVPRVICYGEHTDTPHAPVSILMTRVPGEELGQVFESLNNEDKDSILKELKGYLKIIRGWSSPWGGQRICSLQGTSISSVRLPGHSAGPFESEVEFNEFLIQPAWSGGFSSDTEYKDALDRAKRMGSLPHRVVFTHGDLKHHNILVQGGKITGFLDWESAGWYPEYWDFTTALRFTREDFWWYSFVIKLGGDSYLAEMDCEKALTSLTGASYYCALIGPTRVHARLNLPPEDLPPHNPEVNMSNPEDYTVGWICAIELEFLAAQLCLDETHSNLAYRPSPNDINTYMLGKISKHNVVIACLPYGSYGTSSASNVATNMLRSFPNVRIGLMVGIGGGAPTPDRDIRLGDIVVSSPGDGKGGVLQHDFGKRIQEQDFYETGFLNRPPTSLLTAVPLLNAEYKRRPNSLETAFDRVLQSEVEESQEELARPDSSTDTLFRSDFIHPANDKLPYAATCGMDPANMVSRLKRTKRPRSPVVHYGLIAPGNQLMKDALRRDELAKKWKIFCFEMEAAGLMNDFPCLVIRGICDYSDSHKNKTFFGKSCLGYVEAEKKIADILSTVMKVQEKVKDVSNDVNKLVSGQHNEEQQAILDWLTLVDYAPQHNDFLRRRQRGTGQRFLDSAEYREWLDKDNQTLFCPGIPGAGKTIITAVVIDHLQTKFHGDRSIGIAYIYCNFRRQHEQKAEDLLASLLKQLTHCCPSFPSSVKELCDWHKKDRTRPSLDEISKTLHSVAKAYSRIFITIDALDECENSCCNRLLTEAFTFQARVNISANIIATSKIHNAIEKLFVGCQSLEIYAADDDIREYVSKQINLLEDDRLDTEIRERIQSAVVEAAEGMFLLVKLHIDTLRSQPTKGHMKQALLRLGKGVEGLDRTYEQVMERIKGQGPENWDLAKRVMAWIIYSERPLLTEELQHVLAVRPETPATRKLDTSFLPSVRVLLSLCAGLVTIEEVSGIIRLVYFTAQEFFVQGETFSQAQSFITETCVTYLLFEAFESGFCRTDEGVEERLQSHKLYSYAAHNWGHHARKSLALCQEIVEFLQCEANVEASSQALMNGHEAIVKLLLDTRNVDADSMDEYFNRTPLSYATENGYEAVVKLLLDTGKININSKDRDSRTPLLYATVNEHEAVVKLLLDTGKVDIGLEDRYSRAPLSYAAENGHEAVVKLLLDIGKADTSSKDRFSWTPLSYATKNGHEAVVQLLLDTGRSILI